MLKVIYFLQQDTPTNSAISWAKLKKKDLHWAQSKFSIGVSNYYFYNSGYELVNYFPFQYVY